MGSQVLVTKDQVLSGAELLRRLPEGGVDVAAAGWVKAEGDGQPYLYVVSPTYDAGPRAAVARAGRVQDALNASTADPFARLDPFEVKLLSPCDRLARGLVEWGQRSPDGWPAFYDGSALGGVPIDGAYIYPATLFAAPPA